MKMNETTPSSSVSTWTTLEGSACSSRSIAAVSSQSDLVSPNEYTDNINYHFFY